MADENLQKIDIKKFISLFPGTVDAQLGDDFFIADFKIKDAMSILEYPCRLDGYVAVFCVQGNVNIDINLNKFNISENSLIINVPGNIFRVSKIDESDLRFFIVAMSQEFVSGIRLDFNKLFNESMSLLSDPCIVLKSEEIKLLRQYMALVDNLLSTNMDNKSEILGSMVSSIFYVLGSIWSSRIKEAKQTSKGQSIRAKLVFEHFLKLVTEHHMTERGMAFYAEKLCLTPKYLSKLVKTISGRSAPDWIDSFVILEAKNMLKYSDITIKEIVYTLNFPNQSVFYKFFKSHTGMTPSDYRKS